MRRIVGIVASLALLLLCGACGDDDSLGLGDFSTNFVTYESTDDDGLSVFTFQTRDDLPVQTIASYYSTDKEPGQRFYMRYTTLSTRDDGTSLVSIDDISAIPTDKARMLTHAEMQQLEETEVSVTSLWRSGKYINLNGWVPYSGKKYQLMLVVDSSTLSSDTVDARIVYNTLGETTTFERRVYASFDVSEVWSLASCRHLRVGISGRTFTFDK